ncbi:MAG: hypothetical protein IPJ79_20770 [Bacteroidetes bacterium]|nr:hypothetical protein [Bacteroidota bacterium]
MDVPSTSSIQDFPEFSQSLYEVINGSLNAPYYEYQIQIVPVGGDDVDINIVQPAPGTNVLCTIRLTKPSVVAWDDLSAINNVQPSGVGGPPFYFTANADQIITNTAPNPPTVVHHPLTGNSTCFDIDGCSFPEQCELNDLGESIKNLLGIIAAANQGTGIVTGSIDLATLPLNTSTLDYTALISNSILNALGAPTTAGTIIRYTSTTTTGPNAIHIQIECVPSSGNVIHLDIDGFDPATFTSYSNIVILNDFNAAGQNSFTFNAVDVNNNTLATCTGTSTLDIGGELSMLPLGDCQVPGPIACETTEHNLLEDLGELLGSVDYTQFGPWDNLNLTTSINFTTLLDAHLPDVTLPLNNLLTTGLNGINQVDTLFLDFDDCIFYLNTGVLDTNTSTWVYNPIENLVSINPPLIPVGVPDGAGNYYSFMAEAVYNISGNMVTSVIYGTSCLPIKSCETCPWDTLPGASAGGGRFANFSSSTGSMQTRSEFKRITNIL